MRRAKIAGQRSNTDNHHGGGQPTEEQRPQIRLHRHLGDEHIIQSEREPRSHRQEGDGSGETVWPDVGVGGLPADQHDGNHCHDDAECADRPRPLPQCHPDPKRYRGGQHRGQRRDHGDRSRTQRGIQPPHAEALAHPGQDTPIDRGRTHRAAGEAGQHAQQDHAHRIGDQHHPQCGDAARRQSTDEIADAITDRRRQRERDADQNLPLERRPSSRTTSRSASRRARS